LQHTKLIDNRLCAS